MFAVQAETKKHTTTIFVFLGATPIGTLAVPNEYADELIERITGAHIVQQNIGTVSHGGKVTGIEL